MASYFSSLLTTTTSRVATLRQNLLPSENDGDTLDDTHLCRVLRAYYTEKGRQRPQWLPPDPRAPPPPVVIEPVLASNVGAGYGGGNINQAAAGKSALSGLWEAQPHQQGRERPFGAKPAGASRQNPFAASSTDRNAGIQARPLPSQRAGSYQTVSPFSRDTPPGSSSGITSAKDKFRRLHGSGQGQAPQNSAPASAQNTYTSSNNNRGNYEDRFMPPDNGYGGKRSGGDRPFVSATSPWVTDESDMSGGNYNGGYGDRAGQGSGRQGLPGPGAGRRGPGLPNDPRNR